jgi:DNA-binding HxlR family transcriptional regulator
MRGQDFSQVWAREPLGPKAGRASSVEKEFRQFQQVAAEFSAALSRQVEVRKVADRAARVQRNLQVAHSVFGKWSLDILVLLNAEPELGFADLKKALRGVSSRGLSAKLKVLEGYGLIRREVLNTRPPRVHYTLTERGRTVTRLGEPVLLYLRLIEGLYTQGDTEGHPAAGRPARAPNGR